MSQNTSNSKTSSLLLIYIIIVLLTPPVTILITLIIQCIKQKKENKNSKETRTLSLDNISSPIALDEAIMRQEHHNFISIPHVMGYDWCTTMDDLKFMNFECTKKFFFIDLKLYMLDIQLNKSCDSLIPKLVFKELVKVNGYPDEIYFDKKTGLLECTWYGVNGVIQFKRFDNNMVDITLELNE